MREHRVYLLVTLVLVGGLMLDVFPAWVFSTVDTFLGRSLGFMIVASIGTMLGIPEAILAATVLGLVINRSHDVKSNDTRYIQDASVIYDNPTESTTARLRTGVLRDLSPSYTTRTMRRLGLIPMDHFRTILENGVSYTLR